MKSFLMGVALATALGAAVPSLARAETPPSAVAASEKSCGSALARLARWRVPRWLTAVALGAVIVPPAADQAIQHSLHHRVVAAVTGDTHLGSGIYFDDGDWTKVRDYLSDGERALLDDPVKNEMAIVKLFTQHVYGDYDETRIPKTEITEEDRRQGIVGHRYPHYPWGIRGSHFVVAKGQPRGTCEHKAVVLAELLRRSGLDATMERAMLKEGVGHAYVVVRLTDGEWIADGTANEVANADRYRARNIAYRIDYFGKPWPAPGK